MRACVFIVCCISLLSIICLVNMVSEKRNQSVEEKKECRGKTGDHIVFQYV